MRAAATLTAHASIAACAACGSPAAHPDATPTAWTTESTLPAARIEPAVAALGQQLVVYGGFDQFDAATYHITDRVDVYDTATKTWSTLPPPPVAWTHAQMAVLGTTLYLLGGLEGQYTAHGDSYALDTQTPGAQWRTLAPMPTGSERGSAGIVVAPPRIYLFGGAPSSPNVCVPPTLSRCSRRSTTTRSWTRGARAPRALLISTCLTYPRRARIRRRSGARTVRSSC